LIDQVNTESINMIRLSIIVALTLCLLVDATPSKRYSSINAPSNKPSAFQGPKPLSKRSSQSNDEPIDLSLHHHGHSHTEKADASSNKRTIDHLTTRKRTIPFTQSLTNGSIPDPDYCDVGFSPFYHTLMGDYRVDRSGKDLPNQPINLSINTTSVDCALQCMMNAACQAWSFAPAQYGCSSSQSYNQCWLKSNVGEQSSNECRISGVPALHVSSKFVTGDVGVDRMNGDLTSYPTNGTSRDCAIDCMKNDACYYFAYEPSSCSNDGLATCWLKGESADAPINATCRISGQSALALGYQPPQPQPIVPSVIPSSIQQRIIDTVTGYTNVIQGIELANPFPLSINASYVDCATLCIMNENCTYYQFSDVTCTNNDYSLCTLYAKVAMVSLINPESVCSSTGPAFIHPTDGILNGHSGVDRVGGDMPNMPIILANNQTARDCAWMCHNTTNCVAWSFTPYTNQSSAQSCGTHIAGGCYLKSAIPALSQDECTVSGVAWSALAAATNPLLPSNTIKPLGWLKSQLSLQQAGQAGSLYKFWCDVQQSQWIGGSCDQGLAERFGYWANGELLTSYQLNDTVIATYIEQAIEYIIKHQSDDGWLGQFSPKDPWGKSNILFTMVYYFEHQPDKSYVIDSIYQFYHALFNRLFTQSGWREDYGWFYVRYHDFIVNLHWLYDNQPRGNQQFILDVIEMLGHVGGNWKYYYRCQFPTGPSYTFDYFDHGVNNGQALKSSAVDWRITQDQDDQSFMSERLSLLDKYHGTAYRMFNGDEFLAGNSPTRGSEVCTLAETMFSLSTAYSNLGGVDLMDRLETIAFNGFPATFTKEMRAHQYVQQPNQVIADWMPHMLTANVNEEGQLFGLEPDFGCCTANHPQAWPKLLAASFMQTYLNDDGPAILIGAFVPAELNIVLPTTMHGPNKVRIVTSTQYPFVVKPVINFTLQTEWPLGVAIRVPTFAKNPILTTQDGDSYPVDVGYELDYFYEPKNKNFEPFTITLSFDLEFEVERRVNNALSIRRGPILFSTQLDSQDHTYQSHPYQTDDRAFRPTEPWNRALVLNETQSLNDVLSITEHPIDMRVPFSTAKPGLIVHAPARLVSWGYERQVPTPAPMSPVDSSQVFGETSTIELVPYGQTMIRLAEIPTIDPPTMSSSPTRKCVSSRLSSNGAKLRSLFAPQPTVSYEFDCSPFTNATAHWLWNASIDSSSHTGLASFDGYEHWIDLMQPNQGLTESFPQSFGTQFSFEIVFQATSLTNGFCLFDVGASAIRDKITLCSNKDGTGFDFAVYQANVSSTLSVNVPLTINKWHQIIATATSAGSSTVLSLDFDGQTVGQLKNAVQPSVLPRLTASLARQSAPMNGGLALFTGYIDAFRFYETPLTQQQVQYLAQVNARLSTGSQTIVASE